VAAEVGLKRRDLLHVCLTKHIQPSDGAAGLNVLAYACPLQLHCCNSPSCLHTIRSHEEEWKMPGPLNLCRPEKKRTQLSLIVDISKLTFQREAKTKVQ
jgi:hypothetical protein